MNVIVSEQPINVWRRKFAFKPVRVTSVVTYDEPKKFKGERISKFFRTRLVWLQYVERRIAMRQGQVVGIEYRLPGAKDQE